MRLPDTYRFPGFRPDALVRGIFGDPKARVVALRRRQKKRSVAFAVNRAEVSMIASFGGSATSLVATPACSWKWKSDASIAVGAAR